MLSAVILSLLQYSHICINEYENLKPDAYKRKILLNVHSFNAVQMYCRKHVMCCEVHNLFPSLSNQESVSYL